MFASRLVAFSFACAFALAPAWSETQTKSQTQTKAQTQAQTQAQTPWKAEVDQAMTFWQKAFHQPTGQFDTNVLNDNMDQVAVHLTRALEMAKRSGNLIAQSEVSDKLGECFISMKRYDDAQAAFVQALNLRKQANPAETIEVAQCYDHIAMAKGFRAEDKQTIIDQVRQSYAIYSKFLPADDQRLLYSVKMLAEYAPSPADAVPFRKQIVDISIKNYGERAPLLVGSEMYVLATDLGNSGRLTEAISRAQEAILWCNKQQGYGAYCKYMQDTIDHWQRQLTGAEPGWDVIYHGRYAGRNPRSRPENPNPPTVSTTPGSSPRRIPPPVERPPSVVVSQPDDSQRPPRHHEAPASGGMRYYVAGKIVDKSVYDAMMLSNEACDLLTKHKLDEAKIKLNEAVSLDPDLPTARANLGLVLSKLGEMDEAVEQIKHAVALEPEKASPLSMLASAYQSKGQIEEAVATYTQYLQKFPNESDVAFVRSMITNLQKVIDDQQAILAAHPDAMSASDYLPFCSNPMKISWKKSGAPIKVFVQSGNGVKNFIPSFDQALRESFADWVTGTGNAVTIKYVTSKNDADIDCFFTDNFSQVDSLAEGGETKMLYDSSGTFKHCTIVLLTAHATDDLSPSESEMRAVCLHEIGHSLGIAGHSPNAADIMYCSATSAEVRRPKLSARDLATLKKLY